MSDDVLSCLEFRRNGKFVDAVGCRQKIGCGPFAVGGFSLLVDFEPDSPKEKIDVTISRG